MRAAMLGVVLALAGAVPGAAAATVDLDRYLKREAFSDIRISPGGEYFAATVPFEKSTAVVILRTGDGQMHGMFNPPEGDYAARFDWVNDGRVLIELAKKFGSLDKPQPTGELYGLSAGNRSGDLLVGYRVTGGHTGTRISGRKAERVAAFLNDDLAGDDRNVLVTVYPEGAEPFARLERMDVDSGRRIQLARSPVRSGAFTTDPQGQARFAHGAGSDNVNKLYYRDGNSERWTLINDEAASGRIERALGFSADGALAYLEVQRPEGPNAIVSWNPLSNERRELLRDPVVDPARIIHRPGTRIVVGALFLGDTPRTRFFDETSADARLYRSMEAAFGGDAVYITSSTRDGNQVLVEAFSGRNPGDFYLYDQTAKSAKHLISRSSWIDPAKAATVKPVLLKARDGLPLHGFLTTPAGSDGRNLPMVVLPHGGPFGVFEDGTYDGQAQLLAEAGYAVLQMNFRGSGNQGRAHEQAGARQWGLAMQDDLTDATRWAIAQGIADRSRICIYGASYGGYAALMGVAKEPDLYRCAAGYVGVYDLPLMHSRGDIQGWGRGETYLREWIGMPDAVRAQSPVNLAAQIKVPVFLAAGREDQRAPVQHTERMEAALKQAGVPVESLYFPREGHGFVADANRRAYYAQLLDFLARSLGGATAAAAAPTAADQAP